MIRVLVSACLLGAEVRYHGGSARCPSAVLERWTADGRVVPVCPEVAGGLGIPRPPAEIEPGASALAVLSGRARVLTCRGDDVTGAFVGGAGEALRLARAEGVRLAVLKDGSPSCGTSFTYDGCFQGVRIAGKGVTAAALIEAGIRVFGEQQIDEADRLLAELEAEARRS